MRNALTVLIRSTLILGLAIGSSLAVSDIAIANQEDANQTAESEDSKPKANSEFESSDLAWEYDPYRVKVWICHEQSSYINSTFDRLKKQLELECELIDASGWRVTVENAPLPWNWRLLFADDLTGFNKKLIEHPDLTGFDKLICIRVKNKLGRYSYDAQEFDIRTEQWGAKNVREVGNRSALVSSFAAAISNAFMPLARIDKVIDKEVRLRSRASGLVKSAEREADGTLVIRPNDSSPVLVSRSDAFLPVIRRLDRDGNLESINRIEWTYLSVTEMGDPTIKCTTYAKGRAPLAGRVGRRTQRYALVIRAPNRPSVLRLTSKVKPNEKNATVRPLPGLEVYSRPPGATPEEESEFIGHTDWRGQIKIEPNFDSMRVLYIKSGMRPLARLPMIPGLVDVLESPMPDDEKRLYAEGVYIGMQYELMDLVARRKVISTLVEKRLRDGDFLDAKELISDLRGIDNSVEFNTRLNNELKRLQSTDAKESEKIGKMFTELQEIAGLQLTSSLETLLGEKLRVARDGGDWEKVNLSGIETDTSDIDIEQLEEEEESDAQN